MDEREHACAGLTGKLAQAGRTGLSPGKLLPKTKGRSQADAALEQLIREGRIVCVTKGASRSYLLAEVQREMESEARERLSQLLHTAGPAGISKSEALPKKAPPAWASALSAMIAGETIIVFGKGPSLRYILKEHFNPVELARQAILKLATPGTATARAENDLLAACKKQAPAEEVLEAIDRLVRERQLIRLEIPKSKKRFYLHAASIAPMLGISAITDAPNPQEPLAQRPASAPLAAPAVPGPLNDAELGQLRKAYIDLVRDLGYRDVLISLLRQTAGVPLEPLQRWLLDESRAGRAFPTRGDWSLSDAEARAAAILIRAEPHLRVRLPHLLS